MKHILVISFAYPPLPAIGARRISKITKHLYESGYIPHVVTAKNPKQKFSSKVEIPQDLVHYTEWNDPWKLINILDKYVVTKPFSKILKYFIPFGSNTIPEKRRKHWISSAIDESLKIIEKNNISIIYSSYTPPSSVRVAAEVSKISGIPWINEYRDLWTGNPYINISKKLAKINWDLEKGLIQTAKAIVTVSEPLRDELIKLHNKPTYIIYNGIDQIDSETMNNDEEPNKLNIVYAGAIYPGKRDPTPLFKAISLLKDKNVELFKKIQVDFYGPRMDTFLSDKVIEFDLYDVVKLHNSVSHEDIVFIQSKADVLLLLGWNDKSDFGVLPGKLFEYLSFKKPILALGYKTGAIDQVLQDTKAGKIENDPLGIVKLIENYATISNRKSEKIKFIESLNLNKYLRSVQTANLIKIFEKYG